jgi:hypothetical protein
MPPRAFRPIGVVTDSASVLSRTRDAAAVTRERARSLEAQAISTLARRSSKTAA